jgi:hypothetical protein
MADPSYQGDKGLVLAHRQLFLLLLEVRLLHRQNEPMSAQDPVKL